MFMFNEFQIQGYVGAIRAQSGFVEIDVAVTTSRRDPETGQKTEEVIWNTVLARDDTFGYDWARTKLTNGDLVYIRGVLANPDKMGSDGQQVTTPLRAKSVAYVPLRKADPGRPV